MRAYCLFISILFFGIARSLFADTTWVAGGNVSGEWTREGSPYMILGNLRVQSGETLSIGPGVTLFFVTRCWFYVDSAGRLEAIGDAGDSIRFTTDTLTLPERWGGDVAE